MFQTPGKLGQRRAAVRNNFSAAAAPTVNDGANDGYSAGSMWLWAARGLLWQCISAASGAAAWVPVQDTPRAAPFMPQVSYFHTEFQDYFGFITDVGANVNFGKIWNTAASAGSLMAYQALTAPARGLLFHRGTTAANYASMGTMANNRGGHLPWGNNIKYVSNTVAVFEPTGYSGAPDGTNDYVAGFGFSTSNSAAPIGTGTTRYAMMVYRWSGSAAEFVATTRGSSSVTSTVLTSPTAATEINLRIETFPAANTWNFFVNGSQVAAHSGAGGTNAASTADNTLLFGNCAGIWGVAGTSDRGVVFRTIDLEITYG